MTLPVSNLARSTSFYLAALSPLGYGFISRVQHETLTTSSEAVGLGPQGSSRVDVFLSQSSRDGAASPNSAHVVFPAISRIAVREFYAAALQAGGQPVARPDNLPTSDGMFATIITDLDGNRIEVCFADPSSRSGEDPPEQTAQFASPRPETNSAIDEWREGVADSVAPESVTSLATPTSAKSTSASQALKSAALAAGQSQTLKSVVSAAAQSKMSSKRPEENSRTAASTKSSQKGSSISTPSLDVGGKAVAGTLIGAAAGAALAYTMIQSKKDSQGREEEHQRRLRTDEAKAEARAHRELDQRLQSSGKIETTDRDSGYSSGSYQEQPLSMLKYRNVTYPQPSSNGSRGRSTARKLLDHGPRKASPEYYYTPPPRGRSVGASSQSTVKPARRSQSNVGPRGTRPLERPVSPLRLPQPPPMPAGPPTVSRRNSVTDSTPSASKRSSIKGKPPSSFFKAMGSEPHRAEATGPNRGPHSHHSTRSARHVPLPASEASAPSTAKLLRSQHSTRSARNVPLPASEILSSSTVKATSSHRSTKTARNTPLPLSEAPTALTAKALSEKNKAHLPKTGSELDELATVVPDDSISCASEREERKECKSRASRHSQKTSSRASKRSNMPVR